VRMVHSFPYCMELYSDFRSRKNGECRYGGRYSLQFAWMAERVLPKILWYLFAGPRMRGAAAGRQAAGREPHWCSWSLLQVHPFSLTSTYHQAYVSCNAEKVRWVPRI
jgi:hypothetical protein